APEQDYATRPPIIPAAIAREILHSPDPHTSARVQAIHDRGHAMVDRPFTPGLFVQPANEPVMAYYQEPAPTVHRAALAAPRPAETPVRQSQPQPHPTGWQQPTEYPAGPTHGYAAPVAAVPVANGREFYSRPATRQPPVSSRPVPADVSAMMPAAVPAPSFEPAVLPEDIPGVFMGAEALPDSGWIGMRSRPAAREAPRPLSVEAFESVSVASLSAQRQPPPAWRPRPDMPDLDLVALLTPVALTPDTAPAAPERDLAAAMLGQNDIRQALAPLPDISAIARAAADGTVPPAAGEPSRADAWPEKWAADVAVATTAMGPDSSDDNGPDQAVAIGLDADGDDLTALSFPDLSVLAALADGPTTGEKVSSSEPADAEVAVETIASMEDVSVDAEDLAATEVSEPASGSASDAPSRVTMLPTVPGRARHGEMTRIDADATVPPLRF
ncbi:MAG: hypothetical protein LIP77_00045, partial [Planctomycetes bacterium]|nr:hypothetical protein [Planctomycetota bacterium]